MKKIACFFLFALLACAGRGGNEMKALLKTDMEITGSWKGALQVSGASLSIVFHFTDNPDGTYSCTMDSPDQGAYGLKADSILFDGRKAVVSMKALDMIFTFDFKPDLLSGEFLQRGTKLKLDLVRGEIVQNRPQTPVAPLAYNTADVSLVINKDCILNGTLAWPKGEGPFPVVILLTGSGAQNRDEELFGHKPFFVISDYLARQGIASLRMDDRGTGKSTGVFSETNYSDFVRDAALMFEYVRNQKNFTPKKIGFLGHSEGGAIAPLTCVSDPTKLDLPTKVSYSDPKGNAQFSPNFKKSIGDFMVLLAPPAVSGRELLILQTEAIMKTAGQAQGQIDAVKKINSELYDIIYEYDKKTGLEEKVDAYFAKYGVTGDNAKAQKAAVLSPSYIDLVRYDPSTILPKVTVSVLCLFGALDVQVPATPNLASMQALLPKGLPFRDIAIIAGANHLFQKAETGDISEYAKIEQTIMPEVLDRIAKFVLKS